MDCQNRHSLGASTGTYQIVTIRKSILGGFIALALLPISTSASATTFDINVNFLGGLSATQEAIFSSAENFWESRISGYQAGITVSSLNISASGVAIDGVSGILGQAGPNGGVFQGGFTVATSGIMQFDTADLVNLENTGRLFDVILHEMAHVIGFGTLWNQNGVYVDGTGAYLGANALATYQAEFDPTATFVPVDIVSGPGTRDAHWDEGWAGGSGALMTGFIGGSTFVTDTTLASFEDIGYVLAVAVVPVPAAGGMLLASMGLLFVMRRRRNT